jgi:hypothetical protein
MSPVGRLAYLGQSPDELFDIADFENAVFVIIAASAGAFCASLKWLSIGERRGGVSAW